MIIFLYGPDDYRRTQKKRDFIAQFSKKRSERGVGVFDLAEDDAALKLEEFLESQMLFESAKLAVVDNAFEAKPSQLAKIIRTFAESKTTSILLSEGGKPVKELAFLLKEPVVVQEFKNLTGELLERFTTLEAKKNGVSLDTAATRYLADVFAGDSWGLATELQKLAGLKSKITKQDLDALGLLVAPEYWPMLMGVRSFDMRNRLSALETLLAQGDPAPKIFNILASQWREKDAPDGRI